MANHNTDPNLMNDCVSDKTNSFRQYLTPRNLGIAAGVLLLAYGALTDGHQKAALNAETKTMIHQESALLKHDRAAQSLEMKRLEQQATYAEGRYNVGCQIVNANGDPNQLVSLIEGQEVLDSITNQPLPDNTVVCDSKGNTGVIANGVISDVAFTGNGEVVRAAMEKQGWTFKDSNETATTSGLAQ